VENVLPRKLLNEGVRGRVYSFVRPGPEARCPAEDFLDEIEQKCRKKFLGQFDALTKYGTDIPVNPQRYKPLGGDGKPLWEFKEHDNRLYCDRVVVEDNKVAITLFNGWTKDKEGRTRREDSEILKAQNFYLEFRAEIERIEKGGRR
jgi:hypothetical protein